MTGAAPPRPATWRDAPEPCRSFLGLYRQGFFPMAPSPAEPFEWFAARRRGMIPLDARFHVPRSLRKFLRRGDLVLRADTDFPATIAGCADRPMSWINPDYVAIYRQLADLGIAHSVEAWRGTELVGGLYGLAMGGAFFGESMFSRAPEASKACLLALVVHLRRRAFALLDAQILNDHTRQFGAYDVPNGRFLHILEAALALDRSWGPPPPPFAAPDLLAALDAPPAHAAPARAPARHADG